MNKKYDLKRLIIFHTTAAPTPPYPLATASATILPLLVLSNLEHLVSASAINNSIRISLSLTSSPHPIGLNTTSIAIDALPCSQHISTLPFPRWNRKYVTYTTTILIILNIRILRSQVLASITSKTVIELSVGSTAADLLVRTFLVAVDRAVAPPAITAWVLGHCGGGEEGDESCCELHGACCGWLIVSECFGCGCY